MRIIKPNNFPINFLEKIINNNPIAEQVVVTSHNKLCLLRVSDISPGNFGSMTIEGIKEKTINPPIPQNSHFLVSNFFKKPPVEIIKSAKEIDVIVFAVNVLKKGFEKKCSYESLS